MLFEKYMFCYIPAQTCKWFYVNNICKIFCAVNGTFKLTEIDGIVTVKSTLKNHKINLYKLTQHKAGFTIF